VQTILPKQRKNTNAEVELHDKIAFTVYGSQLAAICLIMQVDILG
jgi:hypothetical protein